MGWRCGRPLAPPINVAANQEDQSEDQMLEFSVTIPRLALAAAAASLVLVAGDAAHAQAAATSFFVTSVGVGNGANLGGLAGADNHCQSLAQAAGAGGKT